MKPPFPNGGAKVLGTTFTSLFDADKRTAREWMDEYFVADADRIERIEPVRVFQRFTTARALIVLGRADEAEALIGRLLSFGRELNRPLDAGEAGALLASLLWAQGRKDEAVEALAEALRVLAPYGYVRVVADEGASVEPVLKSLAERLARANEGGARACAASSSGGAGLPTLERAYVQEVLLAARERAGRFAGVAARFAQKEKPVKLSRQQKLMLDLLARGLRNAEIAEECGLTLPTVKSHIMAAYRKLGVHSAMDAVLRARDLGLIE